MNFFTLNISRLHNEKAYICFLKFCGDPRFSWSVNPALAATFLCFCPSVRPSQWHIAAACMSRSGWTDEKDLWWPVHLIFIFLFFSIFALTRHCYVHVMFICTINVTRMIRNVLNSNVNALIQDIKCSESWKWHHADEGMATRCSLMNKW